LIAWLHDLRSGSRISTEMEPQESEGQLR